MTQLNFNAAAVEPAAPPSLIPAGLYPMQIVESDVAATAKGNGGQVLKFTAQILEGQYANRKVFGNINIRNVSAEAERIGQAQLSALCRAVGVLQLQDTSQLHGRPFRGRVKVRKDTTGQYDDKNEVSGYEALGPQAVPGGAPQAAPWAAPAQGPVAAAPMQTATSFVPPQAQQVAAPAAAVPPWKRA